MDDFGEDRLLKDRKEKQLFLKKEIIDKGYDGGEFAQYLLSKRPNGEYIYLEPYLSWNRR